MPTSSEDGVARRPSEWEKKLRDGYHSKFVWCRQNKLEKSCWMSRGIISLICFPHSTKCQANFLWFMSICFCELLSLSYDRPILDIAWNYTILFSTTHPLLCRKFHLAWRIFLRRISSNLHTWEKRGRSLIKALGSDLMGLTHQNL